MLTQQQLFNKACDSLRNYGSPYGSNMQRGWGFCNPDDTNERCALARFINGTNDVEIVSNLAKELGFTEHTKNLVYNVPVVYEVMMLFDHYSIVVNNPDLLENALKQIADRCQLNYSEALPVYKADPQIPTLLTSSLSENIE